MSEQKVCAKIDESSLRKELEKALMCPIHMEMFVDPMTLVCGHTLCRSDVNDMLERNADTWVQCAVCEKVALLRVVPLTVWVN